MYTDCIVPRMRVGVGDTLKVLVNWIAHESPHEWIQANTKEGILIKLIKREKPLGGSDQGHGHGSWKEMDFGYPQLIFKWWKNKGFMRNYFLFMGFLWYEWFIFIYLYMIELYRFLWCYVLGLRTCVLTKFFRARYIPPTCTHKTLPSHWVPFVLIRYYMIVCRL